MSDNTGKKQVGRFIKGQSGNPSGRPVGVRNKATLAMQVLLEGECEAMTRKAIEMALAGDVTALRFCLERLLPALRTRLVCFNIPPIKKRGDVLKAMNSILNAAATGELTIQEAMEVSKIIAQCIVGLKLTSEAKWDIDEMLSGID